MIWNDRRIREWAETGGVAPYADDLVNPASLDLRLGGMIRRHHPLWERLSVIDMRQKIEDGTIEQLPKWGDSTAFGIEWLMPGEFALLHSLEAVCIPPSAASILVLKSSKGRDGYNHSHCLTGDALIDMPRDLSLYPGGVPIRDLVGSSFLTYAFDTNLMRFVLAPAFAFPAKPQTEVVKVTYEWMTGSKWQTDSITCTPDHRFLTLDCRWVEAQNLSGERLMPLWRWHDNRYAWVRINPVTQYKTREHRFVASQVFDLLDNQQVHHINSNRFDNRPENLTPIDSGVHQSFHSSGDRNPFFGKRHSEETRQRLSSVRSGRRLSDSHRRSMSAATSGSNNPRYIDISLGQIVDAYRQTGKLDDAANMLGVHEGTLLNKIRANGFKGAVDFRKHINGMQNHKVVNVECVADHHDTFDICVPDYENFVANGVVVHNSGWGDPGFGYPKDMALSAAEPLRRGAQWTFEVKNIAKWPVKLESGKPFIQMVMMDMCELPQVDYRHTGHYVYQSGPTVAHKEPQP
jgi:deoxycytidine triphosphate deaminase